MYLKSIKSAGLVGFFFQFRLIVLVGAMSVGVRSNFSNGSPQVSVFTIVEGALREFVANFFILEEIIAALILFSLTIWWSKWVPGCLGMVFLNAFMVA